MDFAQMAKLCAPAVAPATLQRIASVESSLNPFAIGVVGGRLARQPANEAEALATAYALRAAGWDFSVGLVQVNQKNFERYGLTVAAAFDPCTNLHVGADVLADCYRRAGGSVARTGDALSCYYSGNFRAGYRLGYVAKVVGAAASPEAIASPQAVPVIATVATGRVGIAQKDPDKPPAAALFVSTPPAPAKAVAQGDLSPTAAANPTALLF